MIRVGLGKPKLRFVQARNDMSHFIPSHYSTSDYFHMDVMDYLEKKTFDSFDMNPNLPKEEKDRITKMIANREDISYWDSPWAFQMNQLIAKANGSLWQFNAVNSDLSGYVRQFICLGGNELVRWSWFDAYVILPALRIVASLLNQINKGKANREVAKWNEWLETIHKEQK